MLCRQCKRTVPLGRRGLLSGICPDCRAVPTLETELRLARRSRRLAIAIAAIIAIVCAITIPLFPLQFTSRYFKSDEWISGNPEARGQMAESLVSSRFLLNKPREEVISILGEPDTRDSGGQTLRYAVVQGRRSMIRNYPNDLVVRFGKGDEVFDVALEARQDQ